MHSSLPIGRDCNQLKRRRRRRRREGGKHGDDEDDYDSEKLITKSKGRRGIKA